MKLSPKASVQLTNYLKSPVWKEMVRTRNLVTASVRWNQSLVWKSAKPFTEIPSVLMLPFIGTAWQTMPIVGRYTLDRQHIANRDKRKRLGDIIREKMGSLNVVMCYTVEDLQSIIKSEGNHPNRIELITIKAYRDSRKHWFSTTGLLVLQGQEWHDLRSKTQKHLLQPTAIQEYLEPMQDVARDFVQRIFYMADSNKEVPGFLQELYKWSLESVSLVGLDTRLGCLKNNLSPDSDGMKMIQSVKTQFECMEKLEPMSELPSNTLTEL